MNAMYFFSSVIHFWENLGWPVAFCHSLSWWCRGVLARLHRCSNSSSMSLYRSSNNSKTIICKRLVIRYWLRINYLILVRILEWSHNSINNSRDRWGEIQIFSPKLLIRVVRHLGLSHLVRELMIYKTLTELFHMMNRSNCINRFVEDPQLQHCWVTTTVIALVINSPVSVVMETARSPIMHLLPWCLSENLFTQQQVINLTHPSVPNIRNL